MKKWWPVILLQAFSLSAYAQFDLAFKKSVAIKSFNSRNGQFTICHYKENVYKIKFEPAGYSTYEQVSDAVVVRCPATSLWPFEANVSGDTVFLKGKVVMIGTHQGKESNGFYFPLQPNEKIFGAGERALPLNRRGYRLNLYNNPWYGYSEGADNLNFSVPFITSSMGYGLFFDNPSKSYLDIGATKKDILEYGASSGELNVFVIFGDYKKILQTYYSITGTQPLPPRWAFGNLMSRFGYTSQEQVQEILQKMNRDSIPVEAAIFDLFWFGDSIKHTMGNLEWVNKQAWPDPAGMIAGFKKQGIQTILVTEPFFVETSKNYEAAKPFLAVDSAGRPYYLTDFYFGNGGLIDIFRKDAQSWFWQFYKTQMGKGVEAWWGDLGEPEKHPSNLYHNLRDEGYNRLFKADEVHNLFGHTWTKMLFENYAKDFPTKRLFSLNRSGFAGSQRFSIFPWTGDVSRSWSGLHAQLSVLLGMSMSGIPYVHSDAGGFAGGEGDNELYIRWLQFAAFTPIFRPHGTALYEKDPNAFSFPSEAALIDSPFRNLAKQVIAMRYRFLPYNYSLAYQQTKYGLPLLAPLYFYFPNDTTAVNVGDEYCWGENLLVAPVIEKAAKTRKYYLPGGNWCRNEKFLKGNSWYTDSISLSECPIFYKEGAFVVLNAAKEANTSHYHGDSLSVTYINSEQPSTFEFYNDDGSTKGALENEQFELISFSSKGNRNNRLTLNIRSNRGKYRGKRVNKSIFLKIVEQGGKPSKVLVNGKAFLEAGVTSPMKKGQYHCSGDGIVDLNIRFSDSPVTIKIYW